MSSLWDDLDLKEQQFITPKEYLEKQSKLLLEKTNNLVFLEIKQFTPAVYEDQLIQDDILDELGIPELISGEEISYYTKSLNFKVIIKSKSINYEYGVLSFCHDIYGYPVDIDLNPDIDIDNIVSLEKVANFDEFEYTMKKVFSSNKITNVIKSMYSMAKK